MGKLFGKINRGIIVTVVVLVIVVSYLIIHSAIQKSELPDIKEACVAYVQADTSWHVLPENLRNGQTTPTDSEIQKYADSLEPEVIAYYADNTTVRENAMASVIMNLQVPLLQGRTNTSYENNNVKFGTINFRDNTVTVDFTTQAVTEYIDTASGSASPARVSGIMNNQIILQKEGGEWKIVYASLSMSDTGGY